VLTSLRFSDQHPIYLLRTSLIALLCGWLTAGGFQLNTAEAATGDPRVIVPAGSSLLGSAATFALLAGSTVTVTGTTTTIVGDVGVSPGTSITGIPAGQPTGGSVHVNDAVAANAQADLSNAFGNLAGMKCVTNLTGQDLGGLTLSPNIYCYNSSAQLTGTVTLDGLGNPNAMFVFQIGSTLTTASNAVVNLIGGAESQNVYWLIGSSATIGVGTAFRGNIVALTSITLMTDTSLNGRALAENGAVTMDPGATPTRSMSWGRLKGQYYR